MLFAAAMACVRADAGEVAIEAPTPVDPADGADLDQPDALGPGDRLELDRLPLADGSVLTLAEAGAIGPIVLLWFGGAEHADLTAWVVELASGLAAFESRGATLVIVRPLPPARAEAFAAELGLQAVVAADEQGELARAAGWIEPLPDWALLILDGGSSLRYRKLAGSRPTLDELLGVLDGGG